jgi:hypothetical protein
LQNFVNSLGSAIFCAADPEKALRLILQGEATPGPKEKCEYRDSMIAAYVEERKRGGMTANAAYDVVRQGLFDEGVGIGPDAIRRIHTKMMKDEPAAVKAALAWRALSQKNGDV